MKHHAPTTAFPAWLRAADFVTDATDNLHDVDEIARDNGHTCEAFFAVFKAEFSAFNPYENPAYDNAGELIGISINDGHGKAFYNRARAIELLGADAVQRLEDYTDFAGLAVA